MSVLSISGMLYHVMVRSFYGTSSDSYSKEEVLDFFLIILAAACVGVMCCIVPWTVALKSASSLGIIRTEKVVVEVKNKNKKKSEETGQEETDTKDTLRFVDKPVFDSVIDPDSGKPYTHAEILELGKRNQHRIFLAMLFCAPLSAIVSIICVLTFYDWGTLKFCGSVVLVLNGACSSWVATNKKRRSPNRI